MSFNKADPDPLAETPDSLTTYVLGDDIIAQTTDGTTQYLLYDGHGSTRQLAEYDTEVTIADSFSYDGYGVLLQDGSVAQNNPGKVSQQATNLLYAGEQFDTDTQQYYLRARYYDPLNGRFNRLDPFAGNHLDPQSLHKYNYTHCNPINRIDPSGLDWIHALIGSDIHQQIGIVYQWQHLDHFVEINYHAIPGTRGKKKPDIMDYTNKSMIEIRSLNPTQMASGMTKLIGYLKIANRLKVSGIPQNLPKSWSAGTWGPTGLIVPSIQYPKYCAVIIGNFKGLLVYKRFKMNAEKLKSYLNKARLKELVEEMKRYTENIEATDPVLVGIVSYVTQNLQAMVTYGRTRTAVRNVTIAATCGLFGYIGARMVISAQSRGLI